MNGYDFPTPRTLSDISKTVEVDDEPVAAERKVPTASTDSLQKVVDLLGLDRTAEVMGYSTSQIRKFLNSGECKLLVERHANLMLQVRDMETQANADKEALLIVRVPNNKEQATIAFLEAMDIVWSQIPNG